MFQISEFYDPNKQRYIIYISIFKSCTSFKVMNKTQEWRLNVNAKK